MTEDEWHACTHPTPMLEFLRGKACDRKLRLFACAYARTGSWLTSFYDVCYTHMYEWSRRQFELLDEEAQIEAYINGEAFTQPVITVEGAQAALLALRRPIHENRECTFQGSPPCTGEGEAAVLLAEQHADGIASSEKVTETRRGLKRKQSEETFGYIACGLSAHRPLEELKMLLAALAPSGMDAAKSAVSSVCHNFVLVAESGPSRALNREFREPLRRQTLALQADLLREICGPLPFQFLSLDPSARAWNDGTIHKMAQSIYDDCAFDRLPLLADALEDAGCTDAAILSHCRQSGEHVRGCWVVDLDRKSVV